MIENIKKIVKRLVGWPINEPKPGAEFVFESYAQEGEDVLLARMLANVNNGFYVEVGAHHPFRFSNTYYFYKHRGFTGICVDPLPSLKDQFAQYRPNDIFLEMGVGGQKSELTYYMFNEPALNTFDKSTIEGRLKVGYRLIGEKQIPLLPLSDILDKYLTDDKQITFFSVDAEGLDLAILKSNNWNKYRPQFIIAEELNNKFENILDGEVTSFLRSVGYALFSKLHNSVIYKEAQPTN